MQPKLGCTPVEIILTCSASRLDQQASVQCDRLYSTCSTKKSTHFRHHNSPRAALPWGSVEGTGYRSPPLAEWCTSGKAANSTRTAFTSLPRHPLLQRRGCSCPPPHRHRCSRQQSVIHLGSRVSLCPLPPPPPAMQHSLGGSRSLRSHHRRCPLTPSTPTHTARQARTKMLQVGRAMEPPIQHTCPHLISS
jgi:hypothetical protein